MNFRFCCDESFDGKHDESGVLTISGFFSDDRTWSEVENQWQTINREYSVRRFHASPLNCGYGEFKGWSKVKRIEYSSALLDAIAIQEKRLIAFNCGIRVSAYRNVLSEEGQRKLGSPWFACFKSCIAMIARQMDTLVREDTFSTVVEQGSGFDEQAHKFVNELASNTQFEFRHRLAGCESRSPEDVVGLQLADLMAYEYFKRLTIPSGDMRVPLQRIRETTNYAEGFFGEDTFMKLKNSIESAHCGDGGMVIVPVL